MLQTSCWLLTNADKSSSSSTAAAPLGGLTATLTREKEPQVIIFSSRVTAFSLFAIDLLYLVSECLRVASQLLGAAVPATRNGSSPRLRGCARGDSGCSRRLWPDPVAVTPGEYQARDGNSTWESAL